MSRSPITCHVLDSSTGKPANEVHVTLQEYSKKDEGLGIFTPIAEGFTNPNGRCEGLIGPKGAPDYVELKAGQLYKIVFKTKEYFESTDRKCFYPWVEITFELTNLDEHYHIPLLISPYSFTTYRGS